MKFLLYPKTKEILELREELYSMMCDSYDDYRKSGLPPKECYNRSLEIMEDYRSAVKEVERGGTIEAMRRNTVLLTLTYFLILTAVFFIVSLVVLDGFQYSWLIVVGGAYLYLFVLSISFFIYGKLFNVRSISRLSLFGLFISAVLLGYAFPSLYISVMGFTSIWSFSWLIIPVILFVYLLLDLLLFGRTGKRGLFWTELTFMSLVLTTAVYLIVSYFYDLWNVAWIVYIVLLAVLSVVFLIATNRKNT